MSRQWSEWMDVEEGGEDSKYSIHQVVSFLQGGAYRERDYEKAERLLMTREERIRDEMKKKVEVEERLRKEVEKGLELKVEVEEGLRKELNSLQVKRGEAEERLWELEKDNKRLRDGKRRAVEMCEGMKTRVKEMEEDAKERVEELELKVEAEEGLRKRAEEEVHVSENKFKELEEKVLSMQKDIDLLVSLDAEAQGSGMEVANNHYAEAEVEAEVLAPVRVASDHYGKGSVVPSVKTVEKTAKEGKMNFSFCREPNVLVCKCN